MQTTILKGETYLDSSNALLVVTFLRTLWSLVWALTLQLLVSLRNGKEFCVLTEFPCRMIFGPDEAEKFDLGIVPVSVVVLFLWLFGFILIFYGFIKYKSLVFDFLMDWMLKGIIKIFMISISQKSWNFMVLYRLWSTNSRKFVVLVFTFRLIQCSRIFF